MQLHFISEIGLYGLITLDSGCNDIHGLHVQMFLLDLTVRDNHDMSTLNQTSRKYALTQKTDQQMRNLLCQYQKPYCSHRILSWFELGTIKGVWQMQLLYQAWGYIKIQHFDEGRCKSTVRQLLLLCIWVSQGDFVVKVLSVDMEEKEYPIFTINPK